MGTANAGSEEKSGFFLSEPRNLEESNSASHRLPESGSQWLLQTYNCGIVELQKIGEQIRVSKRRIILDAKRLQISTQAFDLASLLSPDTLPDFDGEAYYVLRNELMRSDAIRRSDAIGLTKSYNAFHNPDIYDAKLEPLRQLQKQIDEADLDSFGWSDIDLEHDIHAVGYLPSNDNVRYTISESARLEILRRLAILNKQRWLEEQEMEQ